MLKIHLKPRPARQRKRRKQLLPNALCVLERRRVMDYYHLSDKFIPQDSFLRKYEGKWIHILGFDTNKKWWTIKPNPYVEGQSPVDCYIANNCADEVEEYYGLSMPTMEKVKLGIFAGIILAIVIVIFLLISSAGR